MSTVDQTSTAKSRRGLVDLFPAVFMAALGIVILVQAAILPDNRSVDPVGPRALPIIIGVGCLVFTAFLIVLWVRGDRPNGEEGEDVDLSEPLNMKTVLLLIVIFVITILTIEPLGWVIIGSFLFYTSSLVLGSRRYFVGLAISIALSLATFYGFAIGLGVNLPAGVLQGIL